MLLNLNIIRIHARMRALSVLVGCLFAVLSSTGMAGETEPTILYIDEAKLTFSELLAKISAETGYRIELVGEWPEGRTVGARLKGISLEAGLGRIIKNMGSISHALVFDSNEKKVKIVLLQEGVEPDDGDMTSVPSSEAVAGELAIDESGSLTNEEPISPPSPTGELGLTESQLAAIKDEYSEKQQHMDNDAEITPASEYGPGLTLAEYQAIKEMYYTRVRNDDDIISPSSQLGNGLTEAELDTIKEAYRKQRDLDEPGTYVTPSTEDGKGLTLGELEAIKQSYRKIQYSDDTLVSPPSEQGPGLTLGEVEAIKEKYNKKQAGGNSSE
jgi:hypothetical protein